MKLFKNWHLPENLDVLIFLVLGILFQMADGSLFSLRERWLLVWETELPPENFNPLVQKIIKTVLSVIVVVRCSTTYPYVVSAMLVIFCLLRNTAPKLMLLWILVAGVKSVSMTFLEALVGVYVCSAFGKVRKACIEFFIAKALEIIFSTYLWGSVQNVYKEMERKAEGKKALQTKELFMQKMDFCRQRARSLVDESTLYKTACLNNFAYKDVPQIILQMLRVDDEMSQDSLLGPGMMLASVSNLGSFDHLKTSQSLGELGFMDLGNTQVIGLEEDENLSRQEKALRFLKLTQSDVERIQLNKSSVEKDIYTIDKDTWKRVEASGTHINKPKKPRTQVFIRDILQMEPCDENRARLKKKSFTQKFSFSSQFDEEQEEEEFIYSEDEEKDDDEDSTELVMSNLQEGVLMQPHPLGIVIKKVKANAYSQLYRKDFMSMIGPEVFDKASKLPKVTSLTKLNDVWHPKPLVSLSAVSNLKNSNRLLEKASKVEISETSNEKAQQPVGEDFEDDDSPFRKKMKLNLEIDTMEEENEKYLPHFNAKLPSKSERIEKFESQDTCSDDGNEDSLHLSSTDSCQEIRGGPYYRKRKIMIRRIGRRKQKTSKSDSSETVNSKTPDPCSALEKEDIITQETHINTEILSSKPGTSNLGKHSPDNGKTQIPSYTQQMYLFTQLLRKPPLNGLLTYYDLNRRMYLQKQWSIQYKNQNFCNIPLKNYNQRNYEIFQSLDFDKNEAKAWKSKVLKTVQARMRESSVVTLRNVLNIIKTESFLRRLLQYKYERLMLKSQDSLDSNIEAFLSRANSNYSDSNKSSFDGTGTTQNASSNHNTSKQVKEDTVSESTDEMDDAEESNLENSPETASEESEDDSTNKEADVETFVMEITQDEELMPDVKVSSEGGSVCSKESDEPISLYYSKAANLASPLFDMKRFIYPDHIHYSYKHVKKKGFDVDINGGFPLLMRESLTMGTPPRMGSNHISKNPELEITRRPMDLSFAQTNAFAEWQNNDLDAVISDKSVQQSNNLPGKKEWNSSVVDLTKNKNSRKTIRPKKISDRNESRSSFKTDRSKPKQHVGRFNNTKYSAKDYALIEKLLKMHIQFNNKEAMDRGRKPIQISSTQLHSNLGKINSTYNPAIFLQKNKTRSEKKKVETQEERTKDMFARLEREALLQSKNVQKSFGSNRST